MIRRLWCWLLEKLHDLDCADPWEKRRGPHANPNPLIRYSYRSEGSGLPCPQCGRRCPAWNWPECTPLDLLYNADRYCIQVFCWTCGHLDYHLPLCRTKQDLLEAFA